MLLCLLASFFWGGGGGREGVWGFEQLRVRVSLHFFNFLVLLLVGVVI